LAAELEVRQQRLPFTVLDLNLSFTSEPKRCEKWVLESHFGRMLPMF
jgi:hypothetical protein